MKRRTIFILIMGAILFVVSSAMLAVATGCNHNADWLLPWMTISTSVTHPGLSVASFAPFFLAAHLALCFGLASIASDAKPEGYRFDLVVFEEWLLL